MPNVEHWAGKGARRSPFGPPAARGPVVSAGGRLSPRHPLPMCALMGERRTGESRQPRVVGRAPPASQRCPRRVCAAAVRPDTLLPADGGAVVPVARALTVLPLLLLLRTDCRRAATPAPDSRSSALLTNDRPWPKAA